MKKCLLLFIGIMLMLGVNAQNFTSVLTAPSSKSVLNEKAIIELPVKERSEIMKDKMVPVGTVVSGKNGIEKVALGSSYNMYTAIMNESTCLTSNKELGAIMFTHRQSYPKTGGSGYIQSSFSTDGGTVWDTSLVICNEPIRARYPSGVIYNPVGNTDPNNAYSVIAGPYLLDGSDEWIGTYFASERLDGQNKDIQKVDSTDTPKQTFTRMFMTACDNGKVHVYGQDNSVNGDDMYIDIKTIVNTATFNSSNNNFDWTRTAVEPADFLGADGVTEVFASPAMAWSKDGDIGYMAYYGRNHLGPDTLSYSPIVMKTIDAGSSWSRMAGTDFATVDNIANSIHDLNGDFGTTNPKRPCFRRFTDAAVDADGNLHLLCFINGHSSNHVDSLGYRWNFKNLEGILFDVYTTSTGWDAFVIDTVWAKDYTFDDATESSVLIDLDVDSRPQICKTPEEDVLYYVWLDSDDGMGLNERINFYPDVYIKSRKISDGSTTAKERVTNSYDNYLMYAADYAYFDGTDYTIPITVMPLINKTGGELDPVTHYFIKNVVAGFSDGISEKESEISTISQNYPNPCSDITRIDVSTLNTTTLTIDVFDMMGRIVMQESKGKVSSGTHSFNLNVEKLKNGIYFYTIRTNNSSVTKKMLVN